jgi:hypothetical protein
MPIDMSYTPITPEIADEVLNKTPTITLPESRIESTERNLEPHL